MRFRFEPLDVPEVVLVEPVVHGDHRGFFLETYRRSAFAEAGIAPELVQSNVARSARGVLRGLHYQLPPAAQGKLVGVARGEIFDVAVDVRRGSPTWARWVGVRIDDQKHQMLWVPPGFAHGYCVLSAEADVWYGVTAEYEPDLDRGIRWDDPELGVSWPLDAPRLSPKDQTLPGLSDADLPFVYEP